MAANLEKLDPSFKAKVLQVIDRCQNLGVEMRPYEGLRDPLTQARYWRQSRTTAQVNAKIAELRADGAPFLAHCLEAVGPQRTGDEITRTPPGLSWHQWGEAVDSVWIVDGRGEWSTTKKVDGRNGYQTFAEEAKEIGLTAGGLWPTFKDWPHLQARSASSVATIKSLPEIDAEMQNRFGNLLHAEAELIATAPAMIPADKESQIKAAVAASPVRPYAWKNRGRAPIGYLKGMALMYARSYAELRAGQMTAVNVMSQPLGDNHKDALRHYEISAANPAETLRAVYTLAIGLGMQESSGNTTEGRDLSVSPDQVTAASAEAGLFQVSFDSFQVSPWMQMLFDQYSSGEKNGLLSEFMEGVTDEHRPLVGNGKAAAFQKLTKECPAFAAEYVMLMLRLNRTHFGPINRKQAEYRAEVSDLLTKIEQIVAPNVQVAGIGG